ncbi:apolipoprotein D-like isoform X2 [Anopheles albimanus]|uniref:apolipoprotein D-like isoform X2 n=1 Tax=Anopheles albimanus TaxID=7167 RepID=UPI00163E3495|nr:apolipoprotein D-like isoform X2 [Anopheles albimanus]XP_035774289.1 apolipoprotein D-like isoform X2 [Anopheles albimanus]
MKTIAGCVMLMLMFLLGTFGASEGVLTTKSCVTFDHAFALKEEEFMGKWYEVRRLYDPLETEQEDCVVMNYQFLQNGTFEILKSSQMTKDGPPIYVNGTATLRAIYESDIPLFYESLNSPKAAAEMATMDDGEYLYENVTW